MRGSNERTGSLFSYVGVEARLRPDHPLRAIRALSDETLAAMERELAALYSGIGRPSIQAWSSMRSVRPIKTSRRSGHKRSGRAPIHMVSAFTARQGLVMGQVKVADKSNEIVAIPKLLDMLAIEGAVVTIDAMGCQRDIARKILDKKADYVLALKGSQGTLRDDVDLFVAEQRKTGFEDTTISRDQTVDGDHGRIETRTTTVIHDVEWLRERHAWPGLAGLVVVDGRREIPGSSPGTGDSERETRLYITSLDLPAKSLAAIVRDHWRVENSLHWVTDMVFRDDECRLRTAQAPANFTTIKHIALNLTQRAPDRTHSGSVERSLLGTTTTSSASSPHESFTRFP